MAVHYNFLGESPNICNMLQLSLYVPILNLTSEILNISNMRPLGNFKIKFGETLALMNESLSPKAYGIFCIYVVIRVAWSQK